MSRASCCRASLLLVMLTTTSAAQSAEFSGTWTLDVDESRIDPAAGMAGLIPNGAPATLHITHPANGTLVVESQVNESQARLYTPGRESATPVGQGGRITMTSRWEGRALVGEGRTEAPTGAVSRIKEVLAVAADGRTLTIDITATDAASKTSTSSLTYRRTQTAAACETWPTPCKRPIR